MGRTLAKQEEDERLLEALDAASNAPAALSPATGAARVLSAGQCLTSICKLHM